MNNFALRSIERQAAAQRSKPAGPPEASVEETKDSGPPSLKAVHDALRQDFGSLAADHVHKTLFDSLADRELIKPDQIDLARNLAQNFKQQVTQMEERFGSEITERALREVFGRKEDEPLLTEESLPLEVDIKKFENAEALATELKITEEIIKILSVLSPAERKAFLTEYLKKITPDAPGDDYRALLKEIIEYVLSMIEPYLPIIEPLLPQSVREPGVVNLIEGAISQPLENSIKTNLRKLDSTITRYTELLRQKIDCELSISSFYPDEESGLPENSWTVVQTSNPTTSDSISLKEGSSNEGDNFTFFEQEEQELKGLDGEIKELEGLDEKINALLQEVPDISHALIKAHGYYRLIATGEISLSIIDSKTLKEVQQLANLTILCTKSTYNTNLATATTVQLRIKEALLLRESPSHTNHAIDSEREVAQALEKIIGGRSVFEVARQQFSGDDKRKQSIALLEERERQATIGELDTRVFGDNEANFLMQLRGMDLCQNYLVLTYVFGFQGGQGGDLTKAHEQWRRLHQFIDEGERSIKAYQQENKGYSARLELLAQAPKAATGLMETVPSLNSRELSQRIAENQRNILACTRIVQEARAHRAKWYAIIEGAEKKGSFFQHASTLYNMPRGVKAQPLENLQKGLTSYLDKPPSGSDLEMIASEDSLKEEEETIEEDPDIEIKSVTSNHERSPEMDDDASSDNVGGSMFDSVSSDNGGDSMFGSVSSIDSGSTMDPVKRNIIVAEKEEI